MRRAAFGPMMRANSPLWTRSLEDVPMKKQLIRTGLAAAAVVGGLTACASLRVTSDVNTPLAASVQCHTFAWAGAFRGNSPLRNGVANPLNESRLRTAIATHFSAIGVQPATGGEADCLVGYGIGAQSAIEDAYPGWGYGYGYGWGWRRGWGGPWGWDEPYVYPEGIIALDVYDGKSKQPIWHASVAQSLYGLTGAKAEQRIDAAVAAIFTKYPPR
jgi:hypothetical protein